MAFRAGGRPGEAVTSLRDPPSPYILHCHETTIHWWAVGLVPPHSPKPAHPIRHLEPPVDQSTSKTDKLAKALSQMESALKLLDQTDAPHDIGAHLDMAICRLRDRLPPHPGQVHTSS